MYSISRDQKAILLIKQHLEGGGVYCIKTTGVVVVSLMGGFVD